MLATQTKRTRRDEIMDYMIEYAQSKNGVTPNTNEIAKAFRMAYTTAQTHVFKLVRDGRLNLDDGKLVIIDSEWYPPPE